MLKITKIIALNLHFILIKEIITIIYPSYGGGGGMVILRFFLRFLNSLSENDLNGEFFFIETFDSISFFFTLFG